jgi:hypothetical protein
MVSLLSYQSLLSGGKFVILFMPEKSSKIFGIWAQFCSPWHFRRFSNFFDKPLVTNPTSAVANHTVPEEISGCPRIIGGF